MSRFHPLRRVKTIYNAEARIEHKHNVHSREEAERAGLIGHKDATHHLKDIAGPPAPNKKITRKYPS